MEHLVHITARFVVAGQKAYMRKWTFLGLFALTFVASVHFLAVADLLPNPPGSPASVALAKETVSPLVASTTAVVAVAPTAENPTHIAIPAIGLTASIQNPSTTNIPALDALLLSGAVRYPTSAKLGEQGNVVLFGHSSYLPIVNNEAYKTFNGIQKLVAGNTITVTSLGTVYTYAVRSVAKESATSAAIPLSVSGRVLTLSTCDSFGKKSDRFIVTADFVESHALSS